MPDTSKKTHHFLLFAAIIAGFFSVTSLARAAYEIPSSTLVLYHFENNTSDTQSRANLDVGASGGGYVDMLTNLSKAKNFVAPGSFNSLNTISLNGDTEATLGAWILPASDQKQVVPFGTEAVDLFQQISGWKIRCDLPDFNDYIGSSPVA
jgi:hypothetical protein